MSPTRSRRGPLGLAASDGPGGTVMRRLLPITVGLLTTIAILRWQGQAYGLYGTQSGVVLMTASVVVVNAGLLWYFAHWLDRGETARHRAEQQLRTSARHFELSRDLHCTAGFDGYFQHLNAAWTDTLGWSASELRSRPFAEFVHPDDRARTERESAGLARGGQTIEFVNRYATKDGDWRWIDWRAVAHPEDGLIYASARDVTASKRSALTLVASERQTREILETAYDAYISIDESGLISGWNSQAEATFGWTCEEALGRELAELIIPEGNRDAHRRGIQRFLATGEAHVLGRRLELTGVRREGSEFPVELTISALSTDGGYVFHAFLRDISERRHAEAELALARDQALEASRMKSMFVANVSHEIRTPMNGVIGMSELLLDSGLTEEQREFADTISSSGEALLVILDDILDFSKIEAGRLELDPADFDPRDAIERACGILAPRAHTKGLELLVAIDPEVPALIHGDGARLRQVIGNLVSNAIKFTAEGEVVVHVSLRPADDGAELLRLSVSDSGIGIESHALEQLFKPFSQADGTTTRKYGGTGLGLAISRHLLGLMGGRVGADSRPGEGSCFWLELPLVAVPGTPPRFEETHDLAGLRVLLVDDNAASRTLLEQQLSAWQVTCEGAQDATHAMALLQAGARSAEPYALALIDVGMPGVDGNELARSIRAQAALRDTRLVMLTSRGGPFEVDEDTEADGWLTKPVRESRLHDEIRAVMAGDRPASRRRQATAAIATDLADSAKPAVLVVEDTVVNQAVAAKMLAGCGYRADIAETGLDALHALDEKFYVAILMDCQMPVMDGYETTQEIRRREQGRPGIPIIAMTANSMQGERERCLRAGMDDYLAKPLRKQMLRDALERWVGGAPADAAAEIPASAEGHAAGDPDLLDVAIVSELEQLDAGILTHLISMYFAEAAEQLTVLDGAVKSGEMLIVSQVAHKLKGSSSTLGATRVAQILGELETAARDGDLSDGAALIAGLRRGLDDTRTAFCEPASAAQGVD